MAALRIAMLGQREPGTLAAAARATLDLLPHQLEPALAVVRHGSEAAAPRRRGRPRQDDRGRASCWPNFARVRRSTAPSCSRRRASAISGARSSRADSAWSPSSPTPPGSAAFGRCCRRRSIPGRFPGIRVASLDFAKRPEIRRSIEHVPWDAVVSTRRTARQATASAGPPRTRSPARARFVLLLTATPHSGDPRAFHALCGIGGSALERPPAKLADPLVMFRRNRDDAGMAPKRRVHLHRVRMAPRPNSPSAGGSTTTSGWCGLAGPDRRDATRASR